MEPELPHPSLPGGLISTSAVAASTSPDLRCLNPLIRDGLVPPSLFYFPNNTQKKTQSIRPAAKAWVLTSVEQQKIFLEKVEQKRAEEERKKKWMQEREKKRNEKAKIKKKKHNWEKESHKRGWGNQRNKWGEITTVKTKGKMKKEETSQILWDSDPIDDILEESVEEYISASEEEEEEACFSCKKVNVRGSASEEVEWVACNLFEKWYHIICEGACDEDLVSENYTCKLCCLV